MTSTASWTRRRPRRRRRSGPALAHFRPLAAALLAVVVAAAAHAQPAAAPGAVAGTVRDADGRPLAGASVYLSGTTRGDAADADGRFRIEGVPPGAYRVVASMIGFETGAEPVEIGPGARLSVDFGLAEATAELGDVRVEGERDRRWERRLAQFTRALIGESENAAETRILNPEVLSFRLRWGRLRATAAAPLVVENRALGYRLTYDLRAFSASATEVGYDGDERFEELEPASPDEAARWAEARARAYRGSLRHLLRALLRNRLAEERFSLTLTDDGPGAGYRWRGPASARRVMQLQDESGWGVLQFRGRLEVTYHGEPEEPAYLESDWFYERRGRPDSVQRSVVRLDGGGVRIDPQGTPEDPFAVVTSGYLAFDRLADLVPEEYEPPDEP